ncbi:MAG: ABC transporter ATP-binding protein [Ruminococcus sp.]|nr:ABC transporter ATP-binding protein [Candidatus Apopatosoma intestinale]
MKKPKPDTVGTQTKGSLIWRFLRGSKAFFVIGILSAAITALADMITPQILRAAVDNAIGGKEPKFPDAVMRFVDSLGGFEYLGKHLWIMALGILACALVKVIFQYLFRLFNTKGAETLTKTMRDSLFSHIERLPFSWHMKNKTGDIIQRCTSDIDTLKSFISEQLTSIFRIVIMLTLSLVFMFSMNAKLTLIAMIPMPIIIGYSLIFHRKIGAGFEKCDENEGKLSAMAQENLTGVRVVRAFGRERYEKDRFEEHNEYYTGLWVRLAKIMARFWSTSDIIGGIQILLLVVCGAVFCFRDELTSGEYISFISYNSMLIWPIRQLGRMLSEMSKAGVSIDRILYIVNSEEEKDKEGATTPPMDRDIVFDHVNFAYEGYPELLHDIDFTVRAGTTVGILGGTGSGKSTMMLLLDKLYDIPADCGRITVGGVDIADIETAHLRRNIGMVLQEPYLFSRTLGENIAITGDGIDPSAIEKAADAACLSETIDGFAAGYETFVGERGVTLSGGQKQRAAIARTLLQDAPIMVFDDSLSAVDTETDARIRASLEKRFGSATIFLISHRITTLSKADLILVLENGRIIERGTHEELKKAGGLYQKIYETQTSAREEGTV